MHVQLVISVLKVHLHSPINCVQLEVIVHQEVHLIHVQ